MFYRSKLLRLVPIFTRRSARDVNFSFVVHDGTIARSVDSSLTSLLNFIVRVTVMVLRDPNGWVTFISRWVIESVLVDVFLAWQSAVVVVVVISSVVQWNVVV